jgi:hypothetical protein
LPVRSAYLTDAASAFAGNIFKVRRTTANNGSQRHHGVATGSLGGGLTGQRDLECTRHAHHFDLLAFDTRLGKCLCGTLEQPGHDLLIPARDDNDVPAIVTRYLRR